MSFKRGIVEPMIWPGEGGGRGTPDFALLPPAPVATPSQDLYTPFASEFVGAWWFLRGDGTNQPGAPVTLSAVGSPVANAVTVNGGAAFGGQYTPPGAYYTTPAVASPAGSFSVAWLGILDAAASGIHVAKQALGAGNNGFLFYNGGNSSSIAKTDASSTLLGAGVSTGRTLQMFVLTYRFVADGTSEIIMYRNGVQFTQIATAVGPMQNNSTVPWVVNRDQVNGVSSPTTCFGAFMTEKVLSAATVLGMWETVMPPLRAASGQRMFFARALAATFTDSSGTRLGWANTGRPRVVDGAYLQEPSAQNLILQSDDLTAAAWSNLGAPVRTQNDAIAPDGSKTATRVQMPAVNAGGDRRVFTFANIPVANTTQYTVSFWARATTGTTTLTYFLQNQTLGGTAEQYTTVPLTTTWTRVTKTFTTAGTAYLLCIGNAHVLTGQTSAAWDAEISNVQLELGTVATSPILTTTVAVTRPVDDLRWYWSRTNHARFSRDVSGASWSALGVTLAAATGDTLAPDGTTTAGKVLASGGNTFHVGQTSANASVTGGRRYVWSVYAKAGTARYLYVSRSGAWSAAVFDLLTGTAVSQTTDANASGSTRTAPRGVFVQDAGDGWWRVGFVATAELASEVLMVGPLPSAVTPAPSVLPTYPDAGETCYVWGSSISGWDQVDTDSPDGAVIHTTNAAVTAYVMDRSAYVAKGDVSCEAFPFFIDSNRIVGWDSAGAHENLLYLATGTQWGSLNGDLSSSAASAAVSALTGRWSTGRAVWSPAGLTCSADGQAGAADTSYTPWTATSAYVRIGNNNGAKPHNGYIRNLRMRRR